MEPISGDTMLVSIFMALDGLFAYSAFLPSIMTVGTFVDSESKVVMIRQGEVIGTIFLIALSIITSAVMKSKLPLFFGILAGIVAIVIYEYALTQSPAVREGVSRNFRLIL